MDKETLSHYGWIVVLVLILAVMLAFATPFGKFIAGAIKSTTQGLFDVNKNALDSASIEIMQQEFEEMLNGGSGGAETPPDHNGTTIPEGGTYTTADGTVYEEGDEFPTIANNDVYAYGDYKYIYTTSSNGWSVVINTNVTDKKQTSYGAILESINGKPITDVDYTFANCTKLTTAPEIPSNVTNMDSTFFGCSSLTKAPTIPSSVIDMEDTFRGCASLTTAPDMSNATSVTEMKCTFYGCASFTDLSDFVIPSSVTYMYYTFSHCTSLTTAPEIPSSVTNMYFTFYYCTSLTTAPEIPSSVKYMAYTFKDCTSFTDLSDFVIPSSVTYMAYTFDECTSLTTAPEIPSSVTSMEGTFTGCTSLTGTITINANPTSYSTCFYGTVENIELTGSSTKLSELAATANNGNVTVK